MEKNFWAANFWGIIGIFTGGASLFVSWFTFKYNTPKIEVDRMYLIVPNGIIPGWKNRTIAELKNGFLDFKLEIVVSNRRGGSGSIDKPNLLIKIPASKFLNVLTKYRSIVSYPQTQHTESKKESENITSYWTVRHGRSFNLGGGEKVDEELEYEVDKPDMIYAIVQNFDKIKYFVEYWDNYGKRHEGQIKRILNETDIESNL